MKKSSLGNFIEEYKNSDPVRLHMPGHKGAFGYEDDITEIAGADSLYEACGVLSEAEEDAARLFGSRRTFLSAEGSSQVIKAMCFLALKHFRKNGGDAEHPMILASRNAHKSFICASMLLGFDIRWMSPEDTDFSLCRCELRPETLEAHINALNEESQKKNRKSMLAAVFVTSPDYLGNLLDIKALASIAHRHGLLFLCDSAHGAYLKFLGADLHPLSLGADMTSDSAHKTLPVLTGGALLHISKNAPECLEDDAKNALLMFGSTSPSYLIMQSVAEGLKRIKSEDYKETAEKLRSVIEKLVSFGYRLYGNEPLKIVFDLRGCSVRGQELSDLFRNHGIECEYADPDFLVTMWTPYNPSEDCKRFTDAAQKISQEADLNVSAEVQKLRFKLPEVRYMPREVMYLQHETLSLDDPSLVGRTAADALIACPPAVSPIVAGEIFDENIVRILRYYGFKTAEVLK